MDMVMRRLSLAMALSLAWGLKASSAESEAKLCGTEQWRAYIAGAASRFRLPENWLHAVMRAESGGCEFLNGAPVTSEKGAMGLMQLMPATWEIYRENLQLGDDPYQPYANILAGTAYLKTLHDRFGWPGAAAAYHAGRWRYEEHLSMGRELPRETVEYLSRIDTFLGTSAGDGRLLFVSRAASPMSSSLSSDHATQGQIFVVLRHALIHAPFIAEPSKAPPGDQVKEDIERQASPEKWKAR